MDLLAHQRWASLGCGRGVGAYSKRDGVAAEPPPGAGGEQRIVWAPSAFTQPASKQRRSWGAEWDCALFAALALAADAGAGSQGDVVAVQADEFGDTKAGLDGQEDEDSVSTAFPAGLIGGGEQGVDLHRGQEGNDPLVDAFGRDRDRLLDTVTEVTALLPFEPRPKFDGAIDALIPDTVIDDLIAVTREALTNIARHAHPTQAVLTLTADPTRLSLEG